MKRLILAAVILVVAVGALFLALNHRTHPLHLRVYFHRGDGLQANAPVSVDGVQLGIVTTVRVRPELGENPVEAQMTLTAPYPLNIPNDATVSLMTAGVLGRAFADIDTRSAHGPPVGEGGVLRSSEPTDEQNARAAQFFDALGRVITRTSEKNPTQVQSGKAGASNQQ